MRNLVPKDWVPSMILITSLISPGILRAPLTSTRGLRVRDYHLSPPPVPPDADRLLRRGDR